MDNGIFLVNFDALFAQYLQNAQAKAQAAQEAEGQKLDA